MAEERRDNLPEEETFQTPPEGGEEGSSQETPKQEVSVEEFQKLKEQFEEAQRKITELATSKAALERRLEELGMGTQQQPQMSQQALSDLESEAKEIFATYLDNPDEAAKKLNRLLQKQQAILAQNLAKGVDELLDIRLQAERIKKEKPHLAALQPQIEARVFQLLNAGYDGRTAFKKAVEEAEQAFKVYEEAQKGNSPSSPPPKGSQGNMGTPPPPPPPKEEKIPTEEEWIRRRQEEIAKRFML